ncbi:MAG: UDP-N-acetylmuramoylalanine--D-glutamate ligase [Candidatus Levybacteria bacterium RIFCSPLOWO2_01_FULL_36_13]|nr:MAG: UDP-N-acetylmuramoylalanine--D-glutamate ligase [Candidatus Levybacteria bacterium RIFCSPHIGHO2_01_FULL_36_15b]OGH34099.1 MAG: UDP-N-acetylmuramoylalanine--D-glutamate ligase [Candidatus Levybacteria bacterium RIFCSPLOWO2_01_FULL_36_13]
MNFKNKKIAVIGEGIEGLSSAKFLEKQDAEVTILDQKQGSNYLDNLEKYDLVVRSPGIKLELLKNVPQEKVTSQTKLFFDLCPCPIIGVTGTKGKGTTSSLIQEMLKKSGKDVYLGGNIGKPPLDFIEQLNSSSIVVLELSSFQLQDLHKSPHIAVMLMVTSEHLIPSKWQKNFHKDLDEYIDAKRNLIRFQNSSDFAIINRDYPASSESDIHTDGKIYFFSRERDVDEGAFVKDEAIWLRIAGNDRKVIDTKDIIIPGAHNFENIAAASVAAYLSGVSIEVMKAAIHDFKGLPHRLELVIEVGGVKYYDDSIATNPESAMAAIAAFNQPKILILGGLSEGSDFIELGGIISKNETIKAIIGIGRDWPKIKSKIKYQKSNLILVEGADSMEKIVLAASKIAKSGDIVLLSPACKSYDMFKNYKDRGEQFRKEVNALKK